METVVENHKVATKKIEKYVKLAKVFWKDLSQLWHYPSFITSSHNLFYLYILRNLLSW